jgi:hypothetical protein
VTKLLEKRLCPTLVHVPSKFEQTKPCPAAIFTYTIQDNSSHYHQWHLDLTTNRAVRAVFRKTHPDFKELNPGLRWLGINHDAITRSNTSENREINIRSVTLAAEEQVFLSSLKKGCASTAQQLGAVVDSGATRHAGNRYNDVLTFLPNSFLMYPAIGPPVKLPAVLLGVPTITHAGTSRTLPLPGAGVYDPTMREGLVSIAQLLAARYHVILRLPADCATDGFDTTTYPHYGGFITIPHPETSAPTPHDFIILHFENNTWRLPAAHRPQDVMRPLLDTASQESPDNVTLDLPPNWAQECESIFSEQEQRALQTSAARKLQVKNLHDSLGHCNNRLLAHSVKKMGVSVQHLLPYILQYKCNACTANLGRRGYLLKPTTPPIAFDKDVDAAPTPPIPAASVPLSPPEAPLLQTPAPDLTEPVLDVRADFADSCQIGRSGNRWFLLFVDKTTEYVSVYNTKTRSNPLALLKEYLTFTGKKIRYLRMDNAKEFHSEEMLVFCRDNGIIIQPVVAYNHTAMCRVESYIGVTKSHGRVSMLNANVPLRFHGDAVQDFCIKRNFTWYSQKGVLGNTTAHDRMRPAFDNTRKMFASLLVPVLYLLFRTSTAWSVARLLAIVSWKAYTYTRRLRAPPFTCLTCTASRKSW